MHPVTQQAYGRSHSWNHISSVPSNTLTEKQLCGSFQEGEKKKKKKNRSYVYVD